MPLPTIGLHRKLYYDLIIYIYKKVLGNPGPGLIGSGFLQINHEVNSEKLIDPAN